MEWLNVYATGTWVAGAVAGGLVLLLAAGFYRSLYIIREYGWRSWARSLFRVDSDTWRLVGALLFVAMVLLVLRSRMG